MSHEDKEKRIQIMEGIHAELTSKFHKITKEYPELEFLFMVEDKNGDWTISGNACVKCSEETLIDFVRENAITHHNAGESNKIN